MTTGRKQAIIDISVEKSQQNFWVQEMTRFEDYVDVKRPADVSISTMNPFDA